MYKFENNELVDFVTLDGIIGEGRVKGIALNATEPILGALYIVEPTIKISTWSYDCITVFENSLKKKVIIM